ncbi:MAG TPA: TauD/TfdA family dioxygenase [Parachlamydiaceae bacterium]|nr:TauD/TfdA family dioxygenase [Parachlamydiaceae bacterium]
MLEAQNLNVETRSLFYDFKLDSNNQGHLLLKGLNSSSGIESLIQYDNLLGILYSYIQKGNGQTIPVLYEDEDDPLMNFDPDLMVAKTEETNNALQEFKAILYKNKASLVLQTRELLIIDNLRTAHDRFSFTPYYDEEDRYLYRMFVVRDLVRAQEVLEKKVSTITFRF